VIDRDFLIRWFKSKWFHANHCSRLHRPIKRRN